jgi:hypothetical protein
MKALFLVLITAFSIFTAGCGSTKRVVVEQKQLPVWYSNPPKSDAKTLYAIGEGKSKREAVDSALSLLASTLSVSISSTFDAKSIIKEGTQSSSQATYINQTKSEVKKIQITNYEILNAAELGFKHMAVLIKADKRKLFLGLKDGLDQKFLMLENEEKLIQKEDALRKLAFYKKALASLDDTTNTLAVMKVLDENFDQRTYLQKMNTLKEKYSKLHSKITFSISPEDSNAAMLQKALNKGLSKAGFKVQNEKNSFHYAVTLRTKIEKAQAYGFSIARAEITLTTRDNQNNIIATNVLHIDGQSSQGYQIALQDVSKKFDTIVEREGIAKVLLIE